MGLAQVCTVPILPKFLGTVIIDGVFIRTNCMIPLLFCSAHARAHTHACACGGQRSTLRSWFSSSTIYIQGINPDCRFSSETYVRLVSCHVLFEFPEKLALEEPAIWLKNAHLIDIKPRRLILNCP